MTETFSQFITMFPHARSALSASLEKGIFIRQQAQRLHEQFMNGSLWPWWLKSSRIEGLALFIAKSRMFND